MAKETIRPVFIFENPNSPEAFRAFLRKLLMQKQK